MLPLESLALSHPIPSKLRAISCLQAQPSPQSSAASVKIISDLTSPITKANSTSLLHLSRRQEALPDSGSPLSQENSSHTVFQPGPLEHSHSIGDQSPFHSVLSLTSSSTVFDADSREDAPLKKRKVFLLLCCSISTQKIYHAHTSGIICSFSTSNLDSLEVRLLCSMCISNEHKDIQLIAHRQINLEAFSDLNQLASCTAELLLSLAGGMDSWSEPSASS